MLVGISRDEDRSGAHHECRQLLVVDQPSGAAPDRLDNQHRSVWRGESRPSASSAPSEAIPCTWSFPSVVVMTEVRKITETDIAANRGFMVNLVTEELLAAMNVTAEDFPPERSKVIDAGLHTAT